MDEAPLRPPLLAGAAGAGRGPDPQSARPDWAGRLHAIAGARWFNHAVLAAIALTAVLSGMETYPAFRPGTEAGEVVGWTQAALLGLFVIEIAVRIGAHGRHPWRYFRSGWNLFDFAIVAVCLMPVHSSYVVVLRLLRTLRLFTALRGLQVLLTALLRGIPSLGYVGLLLLLHFYIYAVIGTFAFGDNDPVRFGNLHRSMLTLFQVLTLEGWNDILATELFGSEVAYDDSWKALPEAAGRASLAQPLLAAGFFVSFILIGTMIVLNLVTGVIIRSMEEAHDEAAEASRAHDRRKHGPSLEAELDRIGRQLQALSRDAAGPGR